MSFSGSEIRSECTALMRKSHFLRSKFQHEEAASLQRRALLVALMHVPGTGYEDYLFSLCFEIAEIMLADGRYKDALVMLDHASEFLKLSVNLPDFGIAARNCQINFTRAKLYMLLQQYTDAEPLLSTLLQDNKLYSLDPRKFMMAEKYVADCLDSKDDQLAAEVHYERAIAVAENIMIPPDCMNEYIDFLRPIQVVFNRSGQTEKSALIDERISKAIKARDVGPSIIPGGRYGCYPLHDDDGVKNWQPTIEVKEEDYELVKRFPV